MSQIDVANVDAVLLADRWHYITPGSFSVNAYQFVTPSADGGTYLLCFDSSRGNHITQVGFAFEESGENPQSQFSGPLTSILAVRTRKETSS